MSLIKHVSTVCTVFVWIKMCGTVLQYLVLTSDRFLLAVQSVRKGVQENLENYMILTGC